MNHESMKDKVFLLRDGELPPGERPAVEGHLAACADCRAALEEWKKLSAAFFSRPAVEPSEDFVRGVMDKVRSAPAPGRSWLDSAREAFAFPRWALAGAAGLAAVIVLVSVPRGPVPVPENVQYMAELVDGTLEPEGEAALGTEIEDYFL